MAKLRLPAFLLLAKDPRIPHVSRVVISSEVPNEYGTPIKFTVHENRKGTEWWIGASLDGMKMSATLHTTIRAKASIWIDAVKTKNISIDKDITPS